MTLAMLTSRFSWDKLTAKSTRVSQLVLSVAATGADIPGGPDPTPVAPLTLCLCRGMSGEAKVRERFLWAEVEEEEEGKVSLTKCPVLVAPSVTVFDACEYEDVETPWPEKWHQSLHVRKKTRIENFKIQHYLGFSLKEDENDSILLNKLTNIKPQTIFPY